MRTDQLDELRRISFEVRSETGAVMVRTVGRSIRVEISSSALSGHSEHSLAAEIEQTLAEAMEVHRTEVETIVNGRFRGEFAARTENLPRELRERERLGLKAIEEVEAVGTSAGGYVTARVFSDGDLVIEFTNNPLRAMEVTADILTNEVNEAIKAAFTSFTTASSKAVADKGWR